MKKGYMARILCVLLCVLMLLPTLASCTGPNQGPTGGTTEGTVTVTTQPIEDTKVESTGAETQPLEATTVDSTNEPATETTETPAGETTEASAGETTETPAGETTETPAGETTEAPAGETTEASAGETTEASAGETTEAPAGETTEAPVGETTEAPAGETTEASAGETTESPAPETTESPAPETTEATKKPEEITTEAPSQGGTTETVYYKISFAVALEEYKDRVTLPDTKLYKSGTVIEYLPTPAVRDLLFMGWYYDAAMTREVKLTDTVSADITLYAKVVDTSEDIVAVDGVYYHTAFDVGSDYVFAIKAGSIEAVRAAIEIACVSSGGAKLIEDEDYVIVDNGNGTYDIKVNYKAGKTYRVTISSDEEMCFIVDGEELNGQVTTLNVLTAKEEVSNLGLSDGLIYIPMSDILAISNVANGLVSLTEGGTTVNSGDEGIFVYTAAKLKSGDRVAIYEGDIPTDRDFTTENGSVKYLTITSVGDNGVYEFRVSDSKEVIFIPDVFPVTGKTNVENEAKIPLSALNFSDEFFKQLGMDEDTVVEAGDFIAFFDGPMTEDTPVEYVKITKVSRDNTYYYVEYVTVSYDDVISSMDIYQTRTETPTLTDDQKEAIKKKVYDDAMNSGFIDDAAEYLVKLYLSTNGLERLPDGTPIKVTRKHAQSKSGGGVYYEVTKCEAKPDIKIGDGVLKHFEESDGIRVELILSFEIEFTIGEDGKNKVVISAEAVFEEEILLSVNVDGGAVWEWWGIIPYIADYEMNANIDIGTYTGVSVITKVYTSNGEEKEEEEDDDSFFPDFDFDKIGEGDSYADKAKNIGEELKKLFELNDNIKEEIEGEEEDDKGNDITEKYAEMMKDASEAWIEIVRQEIYKQSQNLDQFGILWFEISIDFVVSAQLYIVAGMEIETGVAKRYNFNVALFSRTVGTDVIDLEKEHFSFKFYCMGTAGIKVGFEVELALALLSSDVASVGVSAELGVSLGIWGYFYYSYEKEGDEEPEIQKAGAMFFELGIYIEVKFKAHLFNIDKLTYNPTLYENLWPIYSVGTQENVFAFEDYTDKELTFTMQGDNKLVLPDYIFRMKYLDLKDGQYYAGKSKGDSTPSKSFDDDSESRFIIEISDKRFSYNPKTNTLSTTVDVKNMDVKDSFTVKIKLTYKHGALAFNQEVITREITVEVKNNADYGYFSVQLDGSYLGYPGPKGVYSYPVRHGESFTVDMLPKYDVVDGYKFVRWVWLQNYRDQSGHLWREGDEFVGLENMHRRTYLYLTAEWIPLEVTHTLEVYKENDQGAFIFDRTQTITDTVRTYYNLYDVFRGTDPGYQPTFKNWWDYDLRLEDEGITKVYLQRRTIDIWFGNVDGQGGEIKITAKCGSTLVPPILTERNGYNFVKWTSSDYDTLGQSIPKTVPFTDYRLSYKANWEPIKDIEYQVKHYVQNPNDDGYTLYMTEYLKGEYNQELIPTKCYSGEMLKSGYTYSPDTGSDPVYIELEGAVVRVYYYRDEIPLRFNYGSGYSEWFRYGTTVNLNDIEFVPYRAGYRFVGWDANGDGEADETFVVPLTERKYSNYLAYEIYPVWVGEDGTPYKVVHMVYNPAKNNYEQVGVTVKYGVTDTEPQVSELSDDKYAVEGEYHFEPSKSKTKPIRYTEDENYLTTMYAYYYPDQYKISITSYDPETGVAQEPFVWDMLFGTPIEEKFLPELKYFNIEGYDASRYTNSGYLEMPAHDIEIGVVFTPSKQTPFSIYHYFEKVDGSFTLLKMTRGKGETGIALHLNPTRYSLSVVDYDTSTYKFNADLTRETYIDRDGTTVLNLYYNRKSVSLYGYVHLINDEGEEVSKSYFQTDFIIDKRVHVESLFDNWEPYYNFANIQVGESTSRYSSYDLVMADDTRVDVYLKPETGVPYQVKYWVESLDGNGYDLIETQNFRGTHSAKIYSNDYIERFPGMIHDESKNESIEIDAANENVLNLYYTREIYIVEFYTAKKHSASVTYEVPYGAPMPEPPTNADIAGYVLEGWGEYEKWVGKTVPSRNLYFSAHYVEATDTPYKVNHYVMDLEGNYQLLNTQNLTGCTNAKITSDTHILDEYNHAGFSLRESTTLRISPDGSTTLDLYYIRNSFGYSYHYYLNDEENDHHGELLMYGASISDSVLDYIDMYPGWEFKGYSMLQNGEYVSIDTLPTVMPNENVAIRVELKAIKPDVTIVHKVMNVDGVTYTEYTETFKAMPFVGLDLNDYLLEEYAIGFTPRFPVNNQVPSALTENVYEIYYDRNTYTITYISNETFDRVVHSYLYEAAVDKEAPVFTKNGYRHIGWEAEIPEIMPASNITIQATWRILDSVPVTILHMMSALDGDGYVEIKHEIVSLTPELMVYGESYATYIQGGTYRSAENKQIALDGSTEVHVYYSRNEYTVRFTYGDIAGAGEDVVYKLPYESKITVPDFKVEGYDLVGWTPEVPETVQADNITYVAIWRAARVNITVNHVVEGIDGGNVVSETETVSVDTGSTINGAVYKKELAGFTFKDADNNIIADPEGNIVVNVYYTRNSYKLTFTYGEMNGEDVVYTVKYGASLPAAPAFAVQGYVLAGWNNALADVMPATDLTYEARWTAADDTAFTVEHYIQNANDDGYTVIDTVIAQGTTNSEVKGEDFKKIFDNASFEKADVNTVKADGSTVIKVYYTRATFKLTFTYGDKVGDSVVYTLKYGQNVNYNPSFSSQGYVFAGWDIQIPATMPAYDVTVNATWTAGDGVEYIVEHYVQNVDDDEYTLTDTDYRTGVTGATINGADVATLVGNGLKLKSAESKEIAADGSTIIKIYYDRESYTVTYTYGIVTGESIVHTVRFGADVPEAPELEAIGYTFAGWDSDLVATMPATNLTFVAQWTANSDTEFTVEHYIQNANNDEYSLFDIITEYGTTGSLVYGADYKQGFDQAIFEKADRANVAADGSTVIKVYYTRCEYTLTFKFDFDSDKQESFTLRYGQTLPAAPTFERVGYTFGNWIENEGGLVDEIKAEMPEYDLTYTAHWIANYDTPFTVEHYVEQANGDGYDLVESLTEVGSTGEWIDYFMYAWSDSGEYYYERVNNEELTILGDGSAVLKIYYLRVRYTVVFYTVDHNYNDIENFDPITVELKCGQTITLADVAVIAGYEFDHLECDYETVPEENIECFIVYQCLHDSLDRDDSCDRCYDWLECTDKNDDGHCDYCCTPNDPEDHRYLDEDVDHMCDICWSSFSDLCYDEDRNGKCDLCANYTLCPVTGEDHADDDNDHICDSCEVWLSYMCETEIWSGTHYCSVCYKRFYEMCTDGDRNCTCDECGDSIPCVDEDGNDFCDVCENQMPCPGHVDEDENAVCDLCREEIQWCDEFDDMHRDDNGDHSCDHCGVWMSAYCYDWDDDGRCQDCYRPVYCMQELGKSHIDDDGNHYCDECGGWMSYICVDENGDWTCDECGKELTCVDHVDEDQNGLCDICKQETKCRENPDADYHDDGDGDHTCDHCGVWVCVLCHDDDYDGHCDENGCNREFVCDHIDDDEDNYCDRCYRIINCTHESSSMHICDECGQKVSDCYDEDGDLFCDECWEAVECQHNGMEGEHVCYFCYAYLSDCYDEDGDEMCDLSEYFPHSIHDRID